MNISRSPKKKRPTPVYPTSQMNELFDAILAIRSKSEAANFFRDLLTIAELTEFTNRWQMVKLLVHGIPYTAIATKLNVSTATVTRVAHWLHDGMGGYEIIASRTLGKRPNPDRHSPPSLRGKSWMFKNPHSI